MITETGREQRTSLRAVSLGRIARKRSISARLSSSSRLIRLRRILLSINGIVAACLAGSVRHDPLNPGVPLLVPCEEGRVSFLNAQGRIKQRIFSEPLHRAQVDAPGEIGFPKVVGQTVVAKNRRIV